MAASIVTLLLVSGCARQGDEQAGDRPADTSVSQQSGRPPAPSEAPLVTTDRDSYTVRRSQDAIVLDIVSTFTNSTADTVYLHPCGRSQPSFYLEKWVSNAWRAAYSPPCPMILMLDPPRVAPGASRTDTARVRASLAPNTAPRFEMDPASGTYRLIYAQAYQSWQTNQGPGELLPLAKRVSAAFQIEE